MYIYLGTYYHVRHNGILSVIQNGEYITLEKKIGKTIDITSRESSLNRTKSPIGYTMLRAWQTGDDTDRVELALHAFADNVRCPGTEWFTDDDDTLSERLAGFMERMGYPEVKLSDDVEELVSKMDEVPNDKWSQWLSDLFDKNPEIFTNKAKAYIDKKNVGGTKMNIGIGRNKTLIHVSMYHGGKFNNEIFKQSFTDICESMSLTPRFHRNQGFISLPSSDSTTESKAIDVAKTFIAALESGSFQV